MAILTALLKPGRYHPRHHWALVLDGVTLDEWLAKQHQCDDIRYSGLVPALGNLSDPEEANLAWQRILPLPGQSTVAPLLICPEHLSFACVMVMAEVFRAPGEIIWRRFGIHTLYSDYPEQDNAIEWIPELGPLSFDTPAYLQCLEPFHLIRLDQMLDLDGKRLVIIFGLYSRVERQQLSGTVHIRQAGLVLESGALPSIVLASKWLPAIRRVTPVCGEMFEGADFYLPIEDISELISQ